MAIHSMANIYVHMIWCTKDREKILNTASRIKLHEHLQKRAKDIKIQVRKMSIQPEHVHLLIMLPSDKSIAAIAKELKSRSSSWINTNDLTNTKFRWKRGYGAFSVSASVVPIVEKYIKFQDAHHQEETFEQEYSEWLLKYQFGKQNIKL